MMNKQCKIHIVTPQFLRKTFGRMPRKDRICTPDRPNKTWLAFEDGNHGIIGQASITKIGRGDRPSNHWRAGGLWIHPNYRGHKNGVLFISSLVKLMLERMPGPERYVHGVVFQGTLAHRMYERMGAELGRVIPLKKFDRPYVEFVKVYREGEYDHIAVPGDLEWPMPEIVYS